MVEPDEPRTYSQEEIRRLTDELFKMPRPGFTSESDPNRPDPPFVRPINFKSEFLVDDSNPRLSLAEKVLFPCFRIVPSIVSA